MNKIKICIPAIALIAVCACNSSVKNSLRTDSTAITTENADTALTTKIAVPPVVSKEGPAIMNFTVYNHSDSARTFCKWHTPFEPLMSKYLDITAANREEVTYKGPMAKRVMPPPADSYITIKPGDSLSVNTDLLKAYDIKNPGDYTLIYNSENISGLKISNPVSFTVR